MSTPHSILAPRLSRLQLAWLQEIGLDRRMLTRYHIEASQVRATPPSDARVAAPEISAELPSSGQSEDLSSPAEPPALQARDHSAAMATLKAAASSYKPKPRARNVPDQPSQPVKTGSAELTASGPVPEQWEALETYIAQCQRCALHTGRSQTVFGAGEIDAPDWMVVGEAPGDYDDRAGLPFQGKAGVLLHAMLKAAGVDEGASVFFTNAIKCRPLGNRTPDPAEIAACLPLLQRQIEILKPGRILVLGALAAQALLDSTQDLDALRGRIHMLRTQTERDIPLVVTYHPASLLLRPQHKAAAWSDLNLARSVSEGL